MPTLPVPLLNVSVVPPPEPSVTSEVMLPVVSASRMIIGAATAAAMLILPALLVDNWKVVLAETVARLTPPSLALSLTATLPPVVTLRLEALVNTLLAALAAPLPILPVFEFKVTVAVPPALPTNPAVRVKAPLPSKSMTTVPPVTLPFRATAPLEPVLVANWNVPAAPAADTSNVNEPMSVTATLPPAVTCRFTASVKTLVAALSAPVPILAAAAKVTVVAVIVPLSRTMLPPPLAVSVTEAPDP